MGFFGQLGEAMKMRNEAKRIQSEISKITVSHSNGGITVVVKGDLSIEKIVIEPSAYNEVKADKPARFETMLLNVTNIALKKARDTVQQEMQRLMQASGAMSSLFGK